MSAEGPEGNVPAVNAVAGGARPAAPSALGKLLAWLPALLYTGLIWWLSSQALTVEGIAHFPFQDKGAHFLEYGGLGLTLCFAVHRTWPGRGLRASVVAAFITTALGLTDELHQAFVPERSADVFDLLADACGASAAALTWEGLRWLRKRRTAEKAQPATPVEPPPSAA